MLPLLVALAGDYCCYQPPLFTSDQARLKAALANLNRVGAVVVAEHMESSLRVGGCRGAVVSVCLWGGGRGVCVGWWWAEHMEVAVGG